MRSAILFPTLLLAGLTSAAAQTGASPSDDPERQALAYEVQACTGGKIQATARVFALQAELATTVKRAEAAEKRAAAAEARLQTAPAPPSSGGTAPSDTHEAPR